MYGIKLGWIIPVFVLLVLFTVIAVGIYQLNFEGNPWSPDKKEIQNTNYDE